MQMGPDREISIVMESTLAGVGLAMGLGWVCDVQRVCVCVICYV